MFFNIKTYEFRVGFVCHQVEEHHFGHQKRSFLDQDRALRECQDLKGARTVGPYQSRREKSHDMLISFEHVCKLFQSHLFATELSRCHSRTAVAPMTAVPCLVTWQRQGTFQNWRLGVSAPCPK